MGIVDRVRVVSEKELERLKTLENQKLKKVIQKRYSLIFVFEDDRLTIEQLERNNEYGSSSEVNFEIEKNG